MSRLRFTNSIRLTGIIAACLFAIAQVVHAQTLELPQRWMDWEVLPVYRNAQCDVDKELAAQTVLNLKKIVLAFLRSNPDYPVKGYVDVRIGATSEGGCGQAPVAGQISISVLEERNVVLPTSGKGRATIKKDRSEGGLGGFDLSVNLVSLSGLAGAEVDFANSSENNNPSGISIYQPPTSTFQGFPVMNHNRIVISPPGYPPLFIPVKLEQALKLAVASHEKRVAAEVKNAKEEAERMSDDGEFVKGMKAMGASKKQLQDLKDESANITAQQLQLVRADLDQAKDKLAKLTPASKSLPAYVKQAVSNAYIPQAESGDGAEPLVMWNPAYFDMHLARSVPQLLVISGFDDTRLDRPEPVGDWQAVQKVDWKALAKELLH